MVYALQCIEGMILGISLFFMLTLCMLLVGLYAKYPFWNALEEAICACLFYVIVLAYITGTVNIEYFVLLRDLPTMYIAVLASVIFGSVLFYTVLLWLHTPLYAFTKVSVCFIIGLLTIYMLYYWDTGNRLVLI